MRVTTRAVYDIETGECLERDSYEYEGPIASCDPGTAALIAAIIGAATTVGTTAFNFAERPGKPKIPGIPKPTQAQIGTEKNLISQQLPTLQSQVGGSVSPEYFMQMARQNAGVAGQPGADTAAQDAISQFFGAGNPGQGAPGMTSGTGLTGRGAGAGLSDSLLQQLQEHIIGGTNA